MKKLILAATHAGCLALGFALGIYLLPILTQPESPDIAVIEESLQEASYRRTTFDRNRADSDAFHWGEGELRVYQNTVVFKGALSPGPDYRLYLTPDYIETESEFLAIKERSQQVGRISTFEGFVLDELLSDAVACGKESYCAVSLQVALGFLREVHVPE